MRVAEFARAPLEKLHRRASQCHQPGRLISGRRHQGPFCLRCRPLSLVLTEGQDADSPRFVPGLDEIKVRGPVGRPRTRPDAVAGDNAYASRANRAYLRKRNIKAVIPEKAHQAANRKKKGRRGGWPVAHDAALYKGRNGVERLINKLKAWRGIATRYDKTPASYLAGLHLRGAVIWIHSLQ
ncbi:transposase [Streptomyces anulatus]